MNSKRKADDDGGKPHKAKYVYGIITKNSKLSINHSDTLELIPASEFVRGNELNLSVNPGDVVFIESNSPDCVRQIVVMSGGVAMTMFRTNKHKMIATSTLPWACLKNYVSAVDPESIKPRYFIYNDFNDQCSNESDLLHSTYSYNWVYSNIKHQ